MPARSSSWPASPMGARPMIPELETTDFETILAPLAGDEPIGTDLRQNFAPTSIYFRLRDARAQARDAERQADSLGGDDNPPTLWRPVVAMAIEILKENAKDLEVATWLTEGLVRIAGPRGLTAGASVIAGLVDRYWDGLYPLPEGEDLEPRVAAVAGLSGQGVDALQRLAIPGSRRAVGHHRPGTTRPTHRFRRPAVRGRREGSSACRRCPLGGAASGHRGGPCGLEGYGACLR